MSDSTKLKHVHGAIKEKFHDKKLVFGHGSTEAKIVFVSEVVGAPEEKEGKPLAGTSGKLINQLLRSAGIDKRKIYITNLVKYRPTDGTLVHPKEIKSHAAFLKEELRTISPQIVVTLGNLALNGVGLRQPIENVHGRTFNLGSYELLPTFHPEHALKNPAIKLLLEADFHKLHDLLKQKTESVPV